MCALGVTACVTLCKSVDVCDDENHRAGALGRSRLVRVCNSRLVAALVGCCLESCKSTPRASKLCQLQFGGMLWPLGEDNRGAGCGSETRSCERKKRVEGRGHGRVSGTLRRTPLRHEAQHT